MKEGISLSSREGGEAIVRYQNQKGDEEMEPYRQGDILFKPITKFPVSRKRLKVRKDGVVAYGEVTGHAHKVTGDATVFERAADKLLIDVTGTAEVVHEDHKTIALPKGLYEVVRQRQHVPSTRRARFVGD
jgi:hypothetical protein